MATVIAGFDAGVGRGAGLAGNRPAGPGPKLDGRAAEPVSAVSVLAVALWMLQS